MVVPTFGEKLAVPYVERFAAYIIISNEARSEILLVQAPNGAYFLPGGEIEGLETKEETVHREVLEELGYEVEIAAYLGQADDYFYSRHRDTYFHNPAYFFAAASWQAVSAPLEDFNQLQWFPLEEGISALKRGSHQWAIQEWQHNLTIK